MIKLLINILRMLKRNKPKVIDCYDLLTQNQRDRIADMMFEALVDNDIHPEIWEMKLEAIIDEEE
tara:strand:- start:352 stop:546 length:195 start_codon:yes stop_codon:yes gene_type:complete